MLLTSALVFLCVVAVCGAVWYYVSGRKKPSGSGPGVKPDAGGPGPFRPPQD